MRGTNNGRRAASERRCGRWWVVAAACWVAACGSDAQGDGDPPPADDAWSGWRECERTSECEGGEVCRQGWCRLACRSSDDCAQPTPVCDEEAGLCVVCDIDTDCRATEICFAGFCEFYCRADEDCSEDAFCEGGSGVCRARGCATAEDCAEGERCERTGCAPGDAQECVPNGRSCDAGAALVCDDEGRVVAVEVCAEDPVCIENPAGCLCADGICRLRLCLPSTQRCVDDGRTQRCTSDGRAWEPATACADGETCVAGACLAPRCEPSDARCADDVRLTCDGDGGAWTSDDCAARGRICVVDDDGPTCVEPRCMPNSQRCNDERTGVVVCDARGTDATTEPCAVGARCVEPGVCVQRPPDFFPAPRGVTASRGASEQHVEVRWQPVDGATGYLVTRDDETITPSPLTTTSYFDEDAPAGGVPPQVPWAVASWDRADDVWVRWAAVVALAGEPVRYRVIALFGDQESAPSSPVTGYRAAWPVQYYYVERHGWTAGGVPEGSAEEGWFDEGATPSSLYFREVRASRNRVDAVELWAPEGSGWDEPHTVVPYRVRAVNQRGQGPPSPEVSGGRAIGPVSYRWAWAPEPHGEFREVPGATAREALDAEIAPGQTRWYRVHIDGPGIAPITSGVIDGVRRVSRALGAGCDGTSACPPSAWCPTNTTEPRCAPRPWVGDVSLAFQWIPRGAFTLGSPSGEVGRSTNEAQVEVSLTRDFYLQRTEVTQGQWTALSGGVNPACFQSPSQRACTTANANPDAPVESVTWWSVLAYANALSAAEGLPPCYALPATGCSGAWQAGTLRCGAGDPGVPAAGVTACSGYRLPTEAEWERAARATRTAATPLGDLVGVADTCAAPTAQPALDPLAWWCIDGDAGPRPVAAKASNAWGLHDMLGNVWEWTWTRYAPAASGGTDPQGPLSGAERVVRGGSWSESAHRARSASRTPMDPDTRVVGNGGFRLARTAP